MLILIVVCVLYGGVLVVLYQRNAELTEAVHGHEEKIRELEKYLNPTEKDSMIRTRLSTTETRVTALDRLVKAHSTDIDMVTKQMQQVLNNPNGVPQQQQQAGGVGADQAQVLSNQIIFVNDRVTAVSNRLDAVVTAQNNLAIKAMTMENTNICVFSSTETCPPRMQKAATFGIIAHSGNSPVPPGYYMGGPFNDNGWNWMHGGLCCME